MSDKKLPKKPIKKENPKRQHWELAMGRLKVPAIKK